MMRCLLFMCAMSFSTVVPAQQYDPLLSPTLQDTFKKLPNSNHRFWIHASNIDSLNQALARFSSSISIKRRLPGSIVVIETSPTILIELIKQRNGIAFIDMPRRPKEELPIPAFDNSLNLVNKLHRSFPQLNGNGQTVSIKENRLDTLDIDFIGRYRSSPNSSPVFSGHASIMATIISGAGNSFYTARGVAWSSDLSSTDFINLLPEPASYYQQAAITVQNHSYGTGLENYYGIDAAAYDQSTYSIPTLLHIFSSGNSGDKIGTGRYLAIPSLSNITGSFKMSKNSLTVGATDSFGRISLLSSKGPAHDGRVKPELTAFGEDGSSGAAALCSGTALVLQQAYKQKQGVNPTASLIKAVLINSSDDHDDPGPDYAGGYGHLNAFYAARTMMTGHFFENEIGSSQAKTFLLTVPAGLKKITVTLCWTDPPAVPNAQKVLINNLDLLLTNLSSGFSWHPWTLNSTAQSDSLKLPAERRVDTLNTVEQISLIDPAEGEYQLTVTSAPSIEGIQPFSIAYQFDTADIFEWTHPTASDKLETNRSVALRWQSGFQKGKKATIEYSLDSGFNWQSVANNIDLDKNFLYWTAPPSSVNAVFRARVDQQFYLSDTISITPLLSMRVGFDCPDSILLYWQTLPMIKEYRVFHLGDKWMEEIGTENDSIFIRSSTNMGKRYFAVAPVVGKMVGLRSMAIDYSTQGLNCYVKSFLVTKTAEGKILIETSIGTRYGIQKIDVEKISGGSSSSIFSSIAPVATSFSFIDESPSTGANSYRLRFTLSNGRIVYSEIQTVIIPGPAGFFVYPNPVRRGSGSIQLLSPDFIDAELVIFSATGNQVLKQRVTAPVETIAIGRLQSGVYFLRLMEKGKWMFTSKIIIQ
ncbi:MAG: S8 family serine peptidase [Chitinophagaceae bacterium]|nr:S8 family serine peptidase [Chitinophagaceae bacterium]